MADNGYDAFALANAETGAASSRPLPFFALRLLKKIKLHLMTDFWVRVGTENACTIPQITLIYQLQKVIELDTARRVSAKGAPKQKPRSRIQAIEHCFAIPTSEETKTLYDCQICLKVTGDGSEIFDLEFEEVKEDSGDGSADVSDQDLVRPPRLSKDSEDGFEYVFSRNSIPEHIHERQDPKESYGEALYYTDAEGDYSLECNEDREEDSLAMPPWMRVLLTWKQKRDFDFIFMDLTEGEIMFMYKYNLRPSIREQPSEDRKCWLRPIYPSNARLFST
ncbi:hypothetical protein IFR05_009856 [Cadophora sp. M221]|nr:hypothetical protein IFR05_009856 [Cadophora sp. M221]